MMECTCTDYRHGHICKHAHKVLQICYTFCALLLNGSKVIVSILGASIQSERKRGQPLMDATSLAADDHCPNLPDTQVGVSPI